MCTHTHTHTHPGPPTPPREGRLPVSKKSAQRSRVTTLKRGGRLCCQWGGGRAKDLDVGGSWPLHPPRTPLGTPKPLMGRSQPELPRLVRSTESGVNVSFLCCVITGPITETFLRLGGKGRRGNSFGEVLARRSTGTTSQGAHLCFSLCAKPLNIFRRVSAETYPFNS